MKIAVRHRVGPAGLACASVLLALAGCSSSDDAVNPPKSPFEATFAGEANTGPGIRMSPGEASDGGFDVRIEAVGPLEDVFSVSFQVTFDPMFVRYESLNTSGSFLATTGVDTEFDVQLLGSDVLLLSATRVGADEVGVDVPGVGLVLVIRFTAVAATTLSGTELDFGAQRAVRVCATPNDPCFQIDDATLNWTGGGVVITDSGS